MHRGEIWLLNLDPTIGAEIKKTGPVVIVSSNVLGILDLRVIVPITEWKDRYKVSDWIVRLRPNFQNGLSKDSCADCFQIRSVSTQRFISQIGMLKQSEITQICQAVNLVIESI
jgi:mRNA interferase MazF